jgi:hypothetical protein
MEATNENDPNQNDERNEGMEEDDGAQNALEDSSEGQLTSTLARFHC